MRHAGHIPRNRWLFMLDIGQFGQHTVEILVLGRNENGCVAHFVGHQERSEAFSVPPDNKISSDYCPS